MYQPKDCRKPLSRRILALKGKKFTICPSKWAWILHPQLAGKISPAPEQSGDISALMYELLRREYKPLRSNRHTLVGVVGATVLANC